MRQPHLTGLLLLALFLGLAPSARAGEESSLKRDLEKAAKAGAWNEASLAARALAAANSKAAVDALLDSAIKFPFGSVYTACIHGLAKVDDEAAVQRLVDKLGSGKPTEKMVLCDAVAKRTDTATGAALPGVLASKRPEVQRAAAAAVKTRKLVAAVTPLIDALLAVESGGDRDNLTHHLLVDALRGITGQGLSVAEDWKNWWATHKDGFRPATGPAQKPKSGGTKARFFGSEIVSNRVVFVIDISGSMLTTDPDLNRGTTRRPTTGAGTPPPGPKPPGFDSRQRILRAKAQLELAVRGLPPNARFTILAFSGQLYRSGNGFSVFPPTIKVPRKVPDPLPAKMGDIQWLHTWKKKPRLHKATDANKKKAIEFVRRLQARGSTFTLQALKYALSTKDADLIVLLSDGAPTEISGLKAERMLNPRQIKDEISRINRFKRIRIDTFQVGGGGIVATFGPFGDFLKNLAKMTGGKFTEVR